MCNSKGQKCVDFFFSNNLQVIARRKCGHASDNSVTCVYVCGASRPAAGKWKPTPRSSAARPSLQSAPLVLLRGLFSPGRSGEVDSSRWSAAEATGGLFGFCLFFPLQSDFDLWTQESEFVRENFLRKKKKKREKLFTTLSRTMADTTASSSAANCLERMKSYVKTQKGLILAAEIVSLSTWAENEYVSPPRSWL